MIKQEDFVLLFSLESERSYLIKVKEEGIFSTSKDYIFLKDLIGKSLGEKIKGKKGKENFLILKPVVYDFLKKLERQTQIIYPKDIGYILLKLGIGPGKKVLECGTGSGALTTAFAYMVGKGGLVVSYEKRPEFQEIAKRNLSRLGLQDRVLFKLKEVTNSFEEKEEFFDAVFLDLKNPLPLLEDALRILRTGNPIGFLLPTTNQVSEVLESLSKLSAACFEVVEILIRRYKPNPSRLRPEDRMVAHTGYLLFARKVKKDGA